MNGARDASVVVSRASLSLSLSLSPSTYRARRLEVARGPRVGEKARVGDDDERDRGTDETAAAIDDVPALGVREERRGRDRRRRGAGEKGRNAPRMARRRRERGAERETRATSGSRRARV